MPFRAYLILMFIGSVLAWISWVLVLFGIDPSASGWLGHALFYFTFFLSLMGSFATLGVLFRTWRMKDRMVLGREVKISFRHAVLLALVAVGSLMLSAHNLLFWWNFLALLITMISVEYAFLLVHESRRS